MPDQIYLTGQSTGEPYNVESATVMGSTLAVMIAQPPEGTIAGFSFNIATTFVPGQEVTIFDDTTNSSYHFDIDQVLTESTGSQPGAYTAMVTLTFTPDSMPFSGTLTGTTPPPCFVAGTRIAATTGPAAVEDLEVGDIVALADGSTATVRWIGHRRVRDTNVVNFGPGSLPIGPDRNLYVSGDHGMLIDGILVPAELLVNGTSIVIERRDDVTLFHVELERHGVLLAEGAPAESYLDTGNRRRFTNCPPAYDGVPSADDPCAPMVLGGPQLEEVRAAVHP